MMSDKTKTTEESRAAYDEWYEQFPDDDGDPSTPWYRLVMAQLAGDLREQSVLEIGCGSGALSRWLARDRRPRRLVGADFSESALRKARRLDEARKDDGIRVSWKHEDIQALSFADGEFDLAISCETLEHVPEPRQGVQELFRVLRPGGKLILTTPNYVGPLGLYRGYLRLVGRRFTEVGQPINHFTMIPRTLFWLRSAGFRIGAVDAVGHYLPFPGRPAIEVSRLSRMKSLRWFALHSMIMAEKPA